MMRDSRLLLFAIVVLLLGSTSCTMWGEKKANSWKTVTSGEELTRLFWQEIKAKNWRELSGRMSATVVGMSGQGTLDREGMLSHVRKMEITDFQIGEVQTQPAGSDLVVTYTLSVRGTIEGHPLPATMRMMSVWQEVKSGWILVAHSSIPLSQS